MRWRCGELSGEVRSLLNEERVIAALPASTHARAITRAREALAARTAALLSAPGLPGLLRSLAIVSAVAVVGAISGVGASLLASHVSSESVLAATSPTERPAAAGSRSGSSPSTGAPVVEPSAPEQARAAGEDGREAREELQLLELARAKLASDDFAAAMSPLAEHARRFRQGRLAEEREALRLRALSGLGRREEVRRAAAAFQARFPRSPLVPVVQEMARSEP